MVREAVRVCTTPLVTPLRSRRSALLSLSPASLAPESAAVRTSRIAWRIVLRQCLFRAWRLSA